MRLLRVILWAAALIPSIWLALQFRDLPHLGDLHDDALYLVSAKSLAEGQGHKILSLPGEPWQTKYPPLFSLWLAAGWRANSDFPANLPWFLVMVWIWLPALAIVSRAVFRDLGFDDRWAWGLSIAILLNPIAAYFSVSLMPELMMATLLMVALALAERGRATWSGLFAGLAFLAKSAALPAMIAVPALYGIRKQYRRALWFALPAWTCFFGWTFWTALHRSPESAADYYIDYAGFHLANHSANDLPLLAMKNIPILVMSAGRLLTFTSRHSNWMNCLSALIGLIAIVSFARLVGQRFTFYHAFIAGFLPMLMFWNFTPDRRFLLPILPLLIGGLAAELRHLPRMAAWAKPAVAVIAALVVWLNASAVLKELPSIARAERDRRSRMEPVYAWIRRNTPPTAKFVAARDPMLYLHTGRKARGMHFPTRYFYHDQRPEILNYFSGLGAFSREHSLTWALVLPDDHAMDLTPDELRQRAARAIADSALESQAVIGPAKVLRLRETLTSEHHASP